LVMISTAALDKSSETRTLMSDMNLLAKTPAGRAREF
jgi:hypothetical protein